MRARLSARDREELLFNVLAAAYGELASDRPWRERTERAQRHIQRVLDLAGPLPGWDEVRVGREDPS